jgi:thiamine biosynthesis lipoprotein
MDDLHEAAWDALGTHVHVLVTDRAALPAVEAVVRDTLERVDRAYSRFRADSELTALNAAAGRRIRVSGLLFAAIQSALEAARWTGGALDPTVGHALRLLGYDRDFAALPADVSAPLQIARVPGWQTVDVDRTNGSVRTASGVELDLGSTGKALAADLAATAALATAARPALGVLVNLGGDIATAGDAPRGGWPVHIGDDARDDPTSDGEVIDLHADALATSSTTVRRWTSCGVVRHHILDPWTGRPADGPWRTVTVAARTCVHANAAATAAIVLGERASAWLAGQGLPARLVGHDGAITRVGGWPMPLPAAEVA